MTTPERIVLVHGLWMTGLELAVLRRRLELEHGFEVDVFAYPTTRGDPAEIDTALCRRLQPHGSERVHLVGHSLGGAFVYRALNQLETPINGNAVLLGSPLAGSRAALAAARFLALQPLIGSHVIRELASAQLRHWQGTAALGAIAGNRALGVGQFFAHFDEENDGTVAVSETRIPGLTDHLVLPHSHVGMLFAGDVAKQVARFLRVGRFQRD